MTNMFEFVCNSYLFRFFITSDYHAEELRFRLILRDEKWTYGRMNLSPKGDYCV